MSATTIIIMITFGFMLLDVVSGNLLHALILKDWKSSAMRLGLAHKLFFILCIVLGMLLDIAQKYVNLDLNTNISIPFTIAFCGYIIVCEIGSIKENLVQGNSQLADLDIEVKEVKKHEDK